MQSCACSLGSVQTNASLLGPLQYALHGVRAVGRQDAKQVQGLRRVRVLAGAQVLRAGGRGARAPGALHALHAAPGGLWRLDVPCRGLRGVALRAAGVKRRCLDC